MNDAVEQYVKTHSKSQAVGFMLTLLFGPLGLFYSSWVAGLILCVIAVATVASVIGPIICWMLAMLTTFATVSEHNAKVKAAAALSIRE